MGQTNSIKLPPPPAGFSDLYFQLRSWERRIYSDQEVARLPEVHPGDQHYNEWCIRQRSCARLLRYLSSKAKTLQVLEVGCGNGWLSARMASIPDTSVLGVDIAVRELEQARSVFAAVPNLRFQNCTVDDLVIHNEQRFDIILFASSIQYFASAVKIIRTSLSLLKSFGEIHILDTRFYRPSEVTTARQRSRDYFAQLGFEEMGQYYFHHTLDELAGFRYQLLYNPESFMNKFTFRHSPFPWIRIN